MPKGYWLATYKKIESNDNLGNYAAKATVTIKVMAEIHLFEEANTSASKAMIFQEQ